MPTAKKGAPHETVPDPAGVALQERLPKVLLSMR
jgi:hypothetical protein